jgi:hypothetical protein
MRPLAGLRRRAQGDGHVANGAAKILLDLARATVEEAPDDVETRPLEDMTPAEKVALFARLDEMLARLDEEEEASERLGGLRR